jgi:two-component system LytT family response regulator
MIINCIIIEDEPLAMERIKSFVLKVPFLNLLQCFDNGIEAIAFTGIQLLESLTKRPEVIITTAFDKYALKGFDLNVCDYLLKPFTFERFMQAVTKVHYKLAHAKKTDSKDFIFIKTEYRLEKINLNEVLYIEGMRDYRCIHLNGKKIMTLQTFNEFEQELPSELFCRVHKSFIVAIDKIENIERDRIRIATELIPISDTFRESFYKLIR